MPPLIVESNSLSFRSRAEATVRRTALARPRRACIHRYRTDGRTRFPHDTRRMYDSRSETATACQDGNEKVPRSVPVDSSGHPVPRSSVNREPDSDRKNGTGNVETSDPEHCRVSSRPCVRHVVQTAVTRYRRVEPRGSISVRNVDTWTALAKVATAVRLRRSVVRQFRYSPDRPATHTAGHERGHRSVGCSAGNKPLAAYFCRACSRTCVRQYHPDTVTTDGISPGPVRPLS